MQIVFGEKTAQELKEKYTVLELETIVTPAGVLQPYCVVGMEHVALQMQTLEHDIKLHEQFVAAIKENNVTLVNDLAPHLIGKFGGELDTFYQIVTERCKDTGSTKLVVEPN